MGCSSSFTRDDFIAENNKEDKLEESLNNVKKRKGEKKKKQRTTESDEEEENEDEDTLPNNKNSRDYTNGIILSENIRQVFQPNLSKESITSMIKAALNQDKSKKRLSQKQIGVIGATIHSVLATKGKRKKYNFSEPITHPWLKDVLVKVGLRELTPNLLKQTCYKDKDVTNEEIKEALENMANGEYSTDIKVLTIEIC